MAAAKRQRRTAEEAHAQILEAAARRLAEAGPRGIRLQEIAADVGVSHPTILHHFGSREGLVEAVVNRALERLRDDVVAAFAERVDAGQGAALVHKVMATLGDQGHARLMAWLSLENANAEDPMHLLQGLARMIHARRLEEVDGKPELEDTLFVVLLAGLALFGEGVLGNAAWDSAGLADDRDARDRFHAWLVRLIEAHLHGPGLVEPRKASRRSKMKR